jgi:3-dehydroquinate synthase
LCLCGKEETRMIQDRIEVRLKDRSYTILIESGLRHRFGSEARAVLSPRCRNAAVISNSTVFDQHGVALSAGLEDAGLRVVTHLIGDGERYKNLRTTEKAYSFLIENKLERSDAIIALGGGVVGDLAGFVAATYLRGIDFIQVPTTLLAQIDSSIGGKTGVNHSLGKNLIGAFHQPKLVAIDPEVLVTLSQRELCAALQEAIKYGVIGDEALFELLEQNRDTILSGDSNLLREVIVRCCAIKAGVVSRDERESGERRILNFGHTVGHALEAATDYKRLKHGEAVGYGIIAATKIAMMLDLLEPSQTERIERLVRAFGPLPTLAGIDPDRVMLAMNQDKKAISGQLVFVLPERIGHVIIREAVPLPVIRQVLSATL